MQTARTIPIILAILGNIFCAAARQSSQGSMPETMRLRGVVADSASRKPMAGAVVTLFTAGDTLNLLTDTDGRFSFTTRHRPIRIEAAFLGFKLARIAAYPAADRTYDTIRMTTKAFEIDQVVVGGRIKKIVYKGDTVQYNAAAFKVLKGATAGDLLEKMPGMQLENGQVKFAGEEVQAAYVDGRKVFGGGTRNLLENLEASDVVSVEAYKELSEEDKRIGNTGARKKWVLNFITFSKLTEATIGHLLGSYGADTERDYDGKRKERYGAGATLNYFSEGKQLTSNIFFNNIDRRTNKIAEILNTDVRQPGDNRMTVADIGGELRLDKFLISPQYSYESRQSRLFSRNERIYAATGEIPSRIYNDSSMVNSSTDWHNIGLDIQWQQKHGTLYLRTQSSLGDQTANDRSLNRNEKGGATVSLFDVTRQNKNSDYNGNYSLAWNTMVTPKSSVNINANIILAKGENKGFQADTTVQDGMNSYISLATNTNKWNTNIGISPSFTYRFKPRIRLSANLNMGFNDNDSKKIAIDQLTGETDAAQTYDYTDHSRIFSPNISFTYGKRNHEISIGLGNQFTTQSQDRRIGASKMEKHYSAFLPMLSYRMEGLLNTRMSMLQFTYNTSVMTPGSNMLNPIVDNGNPSFLQAGNPNLKQSYTHRFVAGLNWMENELSSSVGITGTYVRNQITANRTFFFDRDTTLAAYNDFPAKAGSSLSTYGNIRDTYTLNAIYRLETPINPIECILKTGVTYRFNYTPTYLGTEEMISRGHTAELNINLKTDFSRTFEIGIESKSAFRYNTRSSSASDRTWTENLRAIVNSSLFRECLNLSLVYNAGIYRNPDYESNNVSSHILNLSANVRFLKERNAAVGISIYDLLNKNRAFSSKILPQYLLNSWSQVPGRYIMANFSYRFNYKRSNGKKISDGSYRSKMPVPAETGTEE